MNVVVPLGNLIPVRSVVTRWKEVTAENVERWREIILRAHEVQQAKLSSISKGDSLRLLIATLDESDFSKAEEPPEFEFFTGISLTGKQKEDFKRGRTRSVRSMARSFMRDTFGDLLSTPTFASYLTPVQPYRTHIAARHWHRDPARAVLFATNALPMSLLRGPMRSDFPQRRSDFASVGACGDESTIARINEWAQSEARLLEMPLHALVIDVGRSWHCPALNTTNRLMPRTFLRGCSHLNLDNAPS